MTQSAESDAGVLTDPVTGVEIVPFGAFLPDAVIYLRFGTALVLADLCTPIYDACVLPPERTSDA